MTDARTREDDLLLFAAGLTVGTASGMVGLVSRDWRAVLGLEGKSSLPDRGRLVEGGAQAAFVGRVVLDGIFEFPWIYVRGVAGREREFDPTRAGFFRDRRKSRAKPERLELVDGPGEALVEPVSYSSAPHAFKLADRQLGQKGRKAGVGGHAVKVPAPLQVIDLSVRPKRVLGDGHRSLVEGTIVAKKRPARPDRK